MDLPTFEQACQLEIGTGNVHVDRLEFHPSVREASNDHVNTLALDVGLPSRWMHPIEVVLTGPVTDDWKWRLLTTRRIPSLPEGVKLICISGRQRVTAAKRAVEWI
ncbi:hypothetical protein CPB86DRAFT_791918, partial [Serendipita vermifera]